MEKTTITCDNCEAKIKEGTDCFKLMTMYGVWHFCCHRCLIEFSDIQGALKTSKAS